MAKQSAVTRFLADRRASVAVMSALVATMLVGMAALALDVGQFYYVKRRLQTATDIAALAAAADSNRAEAAASANMTSNGFPASAMVSVERGTYTPDPTLPVASRFVVGGSDPNAVRVTASNTAPLIFGAAITAATGGVPIRAQAIGVTGNVAAFSVGSRLAALDGGVLNALLGGMLGTNLSLTLLDYRALLAAKVDLFGFSDAVAAAAGVPGGTTYGALAGRNLRSSDILAGLTAATSAGGGSAGATAALRTLTGALGVGSANNILFGTLVGFGPFASHTVGSGAPITAQISVLDLLLGMAEIGAGGHLVQASVVSTIPGLLNVTLALAIGEPAVGSSFVGLGTVGTSVHTAQIRILATVKLGGSGLLASVNLPLYIEVAEATGRISALTCPRGSPAADEVDLGITPGIVDAWIGSVSMSDFTSMSSPPSPGPATLVNVAGLVTITARAHVTMSNMSEAIVPFTLADIAAGTVKTTATTDYLTSLVSGLISSLQLNVGVVGLGLGVPGLDQGLVSLLTTSLPAVDQLLSSTLATLGVTLGDADSQVQGLRCGQGLLAN